MKKSEVSLKHFALVAILLLCICSTDRSDAQTSYTYNWSDSSEIKIREPYCAYVNIIGDVEALPATKTDNLQAWMEVYDGNGNYFKKKVILNAQGSTSLEFDKKNFSAEFFDDEWIGDDQPNIRIGDWVGQSAFHFKAYWIDFFRGLGCVGYKLFDQMTASRGESIWQRVGHDGEHNKARCYPDGFPCAVYLNGQFEGIYVWELKKQRKNMNMQKDEATQIHLDGLMDNTTLLVNTINWSSFSVRNPKNLYTMDGEEYDIDSPKELMDETSAYYQLESDSEKVRKQKERSVQVKKYIKSLSGYFSAITKLKNAKASKEEIQSALREQIDVEGFIDYYLLSLVTSNYDGFRKNWQWFTYDGQKWCIAPYDLDCTFGYLSKASAILPADSSYFGTNHTLGGLAKRGDMSHVITYFMDDIKSRYAQLRNEGIFTVSNIMSLVNNWQDRVSESNYRKEWERWPNCNCISETVCNENWEPYYDWSVYGKLPAWNATDTYSTGDMVTNHYRIWRATGTTTPGIKPYILAGYRDSIQRVNDWLEERLSLEDNYLGYNSADAPDSYSLYVSAIRWSTLCLPFAFSIPEGLAFYTVSGIDADHNVVLLDQVSKPEAHKPYLVQGKTGYYSFVGHKDNAKVLDLRNGLLVGTYDTLQVECGNYILQNQNGKSGFFRVTSDSAQIICTPNRAYLAAADRMQAPVIDLEYDGEESLGIEKVSSYSTPIRYYHLNGTASGSISKGLNIEIHPDGKVRKVLVR